MKEQEEGEGGGENPFVNCASQMPAHCGPAALYESLFPSVRGTSTVEKSSASFVSRGKVRAVSSESAFKAITTVARNRNTIRLSGREEGGGSEKREGEKKEKKEERLDVFDKFREDAVVRNSERLRKDCN